MRCGFTANLAGEIPSAQRLLELPMLASPNEPFVPRGDKSEIAGVTIRELKGEASSEKAGARSAIAASSSEVFMRRTS